MRRDPPPDLDVCSHGKFAPYVNMRVDFITPHDQRWRLALSGIQHDIYHLPEYAELCAKYESAAPIAFHATEGRCACLIPLLSRSLPPDLRAPSSWSDAISPYGYSSCLFAGDADWALRVVKAFVRACAERHIITVFVRLHPLLPTHLVALDVCGVRVLHGNTVSIDLTLSEKVLQGQIRRGHRYEIARLSKDFEVTVDDWSALDRFMQVYWDSMRRVHAEQYYFFPAEYFRDLRATRPSQMHLLSVIAPNGSLASAGLFTQTNGIVQYHLSCTALEYRRSSPSKLMLARAIEWAKANGNHTLHLGGGVGGENDGVYRFKAGFSRLRHPFYTWRVICDRERYRKLSEAAAMLDVPVEGFFPAYRAAGVVFTALSK